MLGIESDSAALHSGRADILAGVECITLAERRCRITF